jgi:hypothetical protein
MDVSGCAQSPNNCSIATTGMQSCITTQPACGMYAGSPSGCGARSDCNFSSANQTCSVGPVPGSCATSFNQQQCAANGQGCFWDVFLSACYTGVSEVLSQYPCSFWSSFPPASQACNYHYCTTVGSYCFNSDSGNSMVDTNNDVVYKSSTTFINPRITSGTTVFRVDVWRPIGLTFCGPGPLWPIISIGSTETPLATLIAPGYGSSIPGSGAPTMPMCVTPADAVGTQAYYVRHIRARGNYNFNVSEPFGMVLQQTLGYVATGGNSTIERISVSSDAQFVVYSVALELNTLVSYSAAAGSGASVTITPTARNYVLPLIVMDHSTDDSYFQSTITFYPTLTTTGSSVIEAASRYPVRAYLKTVGFNASKPLQTNVAFQQYTINLEYSRVFDQSQVIGPRSGSDVLWFSPDAGAGPNNAYGTVLTSFQATGCDYTTNICRFTLKFADLPRSITPDGNAFINANGAYASDRAAAMGGNFPFPAALNGVHSFWMNVYSCPVGRTDDSGCVLINHSLMGYPDQISIILGESVYPAFYTSGSLSVEAGLLDTPQTALSLLHHMDNSLASVSPTFDTRNVQIYFQKTLTIVLLMNDTTLRNMYDLRMDINNMTFTPISDLGAQLGTKVYHWADVQSCATHVPKNRLATCPTCLTVPACKGILGCDAMSIPVPCFSSISKDMFNGFRMQVGFSDYLGPMPTAGVTITGGSGSGLPATRNLLQIGGGGGGGSSSSLLQRRLLQAAPGDAGAGAGTDDGSSSTVGVLVYDRVGVSFSVNNGTLYPANSTDATMSQQQQQDAAAQAASDAYLAHRYSGGVYSVNGGLFAGVTVSVVIAQLLAFIVTFGLVDSAAKL